MWRSKCSVSLRPPRSPVLCFPQFGASPFSSCYMFGALALCFPIVRGRPFHVLKVCFSVWALRRFIFQYAALSFSQFLVSPLGALGCLLGRWVRSGPVDGLRVSKKAFPCSVALVLHCRGAFPCSVALTFGTEAQPKRCVQKHFGANKHRNVMYKSIWERNRAETLCIKAFGSKT